MNKPRAINLSVYILALLVFLTPFVTVSCERTPVFRLDGTQLAFGTSVRVDNIQKDVDPSPAALCAFGCALVGAILCFVKKRLASLVDAIIGGVGFVSLLVLEGQIQSEVDKVARREGLRIDADWEQGYYLACLALAAAGAFAIYRYVDEGKGTTGLQAPLPMVPPPPPPPPPMSGKPLPPIPHPAGASIWTPPPPPSITPPLHGTAVNNLPPIPHN